MIEFQANGRTAPGAHFYDAGHAFFNDARPEAYDKAAAELARTQTLAFLREHLA